NALAFRGPGLAYRQLVTAPSSHARVCFQGEEEACMRALGLSEGGVAEWYEPGELAALMHTMFPETWRGVPEADQRACLDDNDAMACARLADARDPIAFIPVGPAARSALVVEALRTGGSGAYLRLARAGDVPTGEALALAAGRPVSTFLPAWRARLLEDRPERRTGAGRAPLAAVAWLAVFSAVAIRRRSWRA
ncbi:MAG TPA: hypothetical protein VMK65_04275, partial [Longimicrobiales bacterium]|nr:hypothetical protein [Longimicrobiales bacterium]